jgi:sulfite exporter TauE/SafE
MTGIDPPLLIAAWLAGLAGGSGHCLGMCGGIVGMLGIRQKAGLAGHATLLTAHLGRIGGYAIAGAAVGTVGSGVAGAVLGTHGLFALRGAAAVLVLLLGAQLLLGQPLLGPIERQGAKLWRPIAPLVRKLLPARTPLAALAVGALWGFLPCGLVYAQLAVAAASGGTLAGALVMASFGLGTVLALSVVSTLLHSIGLSRLPRQASGALLLVFGLWTAAPLLLAHEHSVPSPASAAAPTEHVHHHH